ncbi:MAG: restriction endonuclease [Phormidium sp. BM_Day4_Bin.17]|nr:restriction endonuclease [Phormidium sp. BM_Day4_Bin.17]UCJ12594.1 MAG: restriction endonuclease [Phormidium sp. PBR-2020]
MVQKRTIEDLHQSASLFWPEFLVQRQLEQSILPVLIETQQQFLSILALELDNPWDIFTALEISKLSANLFLKHLLILADFGGEKLQRLNQEFGLLFPDGELEYVWDGRQFSYSFEVLPISGSLSNQKLKVSSKKVLSKKQPLSEVYKDIIVILLFAGNAINPKTSGIFKTWGCQIGQFIGRYHELSEFIRQRYVYVSRITAGAKSNELGQLLQRHIYLDLQTKLGQHNIDVKLNSTIPGVSHQQTGKRDTNFDIVVSKAEKYIAIEISFQETTNSTIERKAGQAKSRFENIDDLGHKIVYIIDGVGNFKRQAALTTIDGYSHLLLAFSNSELNRLHHFILNFLENENC